MMAGGCCVLLALESAHQAAKGHEAYHHGTAHGGNRQHQLIHSTKLSHCDNGVIMLHLHMKHTH
jgi:hypothetical protein